MKNMSQKTLLKLKQTIIKIYKNARFPRMIWVKSYQLMKQIQKSFNNFFKKKSKIFKKAMFFPVYNEYA